MKFRFKEGERIRVEFKGIFYAANIKKQIDSFEGPKYNLIPIIKLDPREPPPFSTSLEFKQRELFTIKEFKAIARYLTLKAKESSS